MTKPWERDWGKSDSTALPGDTPDPVVDPSGGQVSGGKPWEREWAPAGGDRRIFSGQEIGDAIRDGGSSERPPRLDAAKRGFFKGAEVGFRAAAGAAELAEWPNVTSQFRDWQEQARNSADGFAEQPAEEVVERIARVVPRGGASFLEGGLKAYANAGAGIAQLFNKDELSDELESIAGDLQADRQERIWELFAQDQTPDAIIETGMQVMGDVVGNLGLMRNAMMLMGSNGLAAPGAGWKHMAKGTSIRAAQMAMLNLLRTKGSWKERSTSAALGFLYMATPALSSVAPSDVSAVAFDFMLNSIITAGFDPQDKRFTKLIDIDEETGLPIPGGQYKRAMEDARAQAEASGEPERTWQFALVNVLPIVGTDIGFSMLTRSAKARNNHVKMALDTERPDTATMSAGQKELYQHYTTAAEKSGVPADLAGRMNLAALKMVADGTLSGKQLAGAAQAQWRTKPSPVEAIRPTTAVPAEAGRTLIQRTEIKDAPEIIRDNEIKDLDGTITERISPSFEEQVIKTGERAGILDKQKPGVPLKDVPEDPVKVLWDEARTELVPAKPTVSKESSTPAEPGRTPTAEPRKFEGAVQHRLSPSVIRKTKYKDLKTAAKENTYADGTPVWNTASGRSATDLRKALLDHRSVYMDTEGKLERKAVSAETRAKLSKAAKARMARSEDEAIVDNLILREQRQSFSGEVKPVNEADLVDGDLVRVGQEWLRVQQDAKGGVTLQDNVDIKLGSFETFEAERHIREGDPSFDETLQQFRQQEGAKPDAGGIAPPQGQLIPESEGGFRLAGERATDAERDVRTAEQAEIDRAISEGEQGKLDMSNPAAVKKLQEAKTQKQLNETAELRRRRTGGPRSSARAASEAEGAAARAPGYGELPEDNPKVTALPIGMPELVKLTSDLLDGKMPNIVKQVRLLHGTALGAFRHTKDTGSIELRADIFRLISPERTQELVDEAKAYAEKIGPAIDEDGKIVRTVDEIAEARNEFLRDQELQRAKQLGPKKATDVLAHEIGHVIDWLPEKTLQRGNILGHIASLKKNMMTTLAKMPKDMDNILTKKDRAELRKQAERAAGPKPRDITAPGQKKLDLPKNTQEKLDARLGVWRAKVHRELGQLTKQAAHDRGLVTRDQINAELEGAIAWWHGTEKMPAYFEQPKEMYADALSILLNNPAALQKRAPYFYESFFNWYDSKPKIKVDYDAIQNRIKSGEIYQDRVTTVREGFEVAAEKRFDAHGRRKTFDDLKKQATDIGLGLRTLYIDKFSALYDRIRAVGEKDLPIEENPRYPLEDMLWSGSEHEMYDRLLSRGPLKTLKNAGVQWVDLDEYAMHKRIVGERFDLANPWGFTPKESGERLAEMRKDWGEAKMAALESARKDTVDMRRQLVLKPIEEAGIWGDELMSKTKDNDFYATFNVTEFMDKQYGSGAGAHVYAQIGTLKGIEGPATATLYKDASLISSTHRHVAKRSAAEFLLNHFPDDITPADKKWSGTGWRLQAVENDEKGTIMYLQDGKIRGYYVPKLIADGFNANPALDARSIASVLNVITQPFRELFVGANLGFATFNARRDWLRMARGIQGINRVKAAKFWAKGLTHSAKDSLGIPSDVVDEMLKGNMLISMYSPRGVRPDESAFEKQVARYRLDRKSFRAKVLKAGEIVTFPYHVAKAIGEVVERAPKIGAYMYLKENYAPDMSTKEIAHQIRTQAGSPAFLRHGSAYPIYNNLFPFSNAIKEGFRSEAALMQERPAEWFYKQLTYTVMPKMLQWGLKAGIVGSGLAVTVKQFGASEDEEFSETVTTTFADMYANISERDMANSLVIPLGMTTTGKTVYLAMPMDEQQRMVGGLIYKMLTKEQDEMFSAMGDYLGGDVPKLTPLVKVVAAYGAYKGGHNPYDPFREKHVFSDAVWDARDADDGKRTDEVMWKWAANQLGVGIVYRFKSEQLGEIKTDLEKILGAPVNSNLMGRWIKVSDFGRTEELREAGAEGRAEWQDMNLNVREAAGRLMKNEELSDRDLVLLASRADYTDLVLKRAMVRRFGSAFIREYLSARSQIEQAKILQKAQEIDERTRLKR
ncbi:hypothetical protein N9937_01635 [bacterium]|nr:hypothetical protein [bacterium]